MLLRAGKERGFLQGCAALCRSCLIRKPGETAHLTPNMLVFQFILKGWWDRFCPYLKKNIYIYVCIYTHTHTPALHTYNIHICATTSNNQASLLPQSNKPLPSHVTSWNAQMEQNYYIDYMWKGKLRNIIFLKTPSCQAKNSPCVEEEQDNWL